ncbi:MAG: hypothetical protein NTY68_04290, partial [Candidatus Micrarchaeota archaeon]|nr:hypothetical protein [Candidatus Micrarchaeota archaeon]
MELNPDAIEYFNIFESFTGVMPLDMIDVRGSLFFIVAPDKIGLVLTGKGRKIENLKAKIDRNVYIVANSDDPLQFARNLFNNVRILETTDENIMGETVLYLIVDEKDKSK